MLELDSGLSGEPFRRGMTADQLIEKLQELDGRQHLEVHIVDDETEEVYDTFEIRRGWGNTGSPEVPGKVIIYLAINSWD